MNIGPEHINRKITLKNMVGKYLVMAVDLKSNSIWLKDEKGQCTTNSNLDWELVEEIKKPSDEIRARLISSKPFQYGSLPLDNVVYAIIAYLDEVLPPLLEKK